MESTYESHNRIMNKAFPIGISRHNRSNDDNIHWHENIEILYFTGGECTVVNGSDEIYAVAGDIVIINSEDLHGIRFNDKFSQYILLHLDQTFCESLGFHTSDTRFFKKIRNEQIGEIMENAIAEYNAKAPYYQESIKIMVLTILLILFRNYVANDSKSEKMSNKVKLTKRIIKYISRHYDEQLTIENIESYCRYSRFYISRAFKEITGLTIMAYLNDIRIEKAKSLLQISTLNMNEVAAKCGFVSQSYFGKVFKKCEGLSPLEYKNKERLI